MRKPIPATWQVKITDFNTREIIATDNFRGTSVLASVVQDVNHQAQRSLPGVEWGEYSAIRSGEIRCRRSKCRNYQQAIYYKGGGDTK